MSEPQERVDSIEVAGVQLKVNLPNIRELLNNYAAIRPQLEGILPPLALDYVTSADAVAAELTRLVEGLEVMEKAAIALGVGLPAEPPPDNCPCDNCKRRRALQKRWAN